MKKIRPLFIIGASLIPACLALIAFSIEMLMPSGPWTQHGITAALATLAVLLMVLFMILLKRFDAFARAAEQSATRDTLTNLYNRTTFWDFLGYETERAKRQQYRFSLMLVDLDNFKAINDLYGHETGDECLLKFAGLFKTAIRKGDIPARYEGDGFAAILPLCDEAQAYIVAKRLLHNLREYAHALPERGPVRMTVSIGIALYPDHAQGVQDLFLLADSMLRQAKISGKDRVNIPSDEVNVDVLKGAGEKSIFIMESIRERRIVPYFQPIVCTKERSVLAHEILMRIVTPGRVIPAAEFIDAAEGMGAIGKINYQLLEQSFDLVRRGGYPGQLFMNLSPKALVIKEFMPTVRRMMRDFGFSPEQMVFEITERDSVKNLGLIEKSVNELKSDGFRFAIDDFGSGYSSFQYIKTFKVNFLKIDGEFIRHMDGNDGMEKAIVANIARLAEGLGIKTIAEYVETEGIFNRVRSVGIDYAQGYYIRHPQPDLVMK